MTLALGFYSRAWPRYWRGDVHGAAADAQAAYDAWSGEFTMYLPGGGVLARPVARRARRHRGCRRGRRAAVRRGAVVGDAYARRPAHGAGRRGAGPGRPGRRGPQARGGGKQRHAEAAAEPGFLPVAILACPRAVAHGRSRGRASGGRRGARARPGLRCPAARRRGPPRPRHGGGRAAGDRAARGVRGGAQDIAVPARAGARARRARGGVAPAGASRGGPQPVARRARARRVARARQARAACSRRARSRPARARDRARRWAWRR